jgi:hypothetical protein
MASLAASQGGSVPGGARKVGLMQLVINTCRVTIQENV